MSSSNQVNIVNQALLAVGSQSQISSFTEGTPQANAASTLFTPRFTALARSAPWNCLRQEATLTLLAAAQGTPENPDGTILPLPPVPWLYSYQLPSDCLQMRYIVPSLPAPNSGVPLFPVNTNAATWLQTPGQIPYAVAYSTDSNGNPLQVILTNQTQAVAVYTVNQPNPSIWDSLFEQAMVATLAAWLVPALSLHLPLMKMQIEIAERLVMEARVRDGNEGVTSMDHQPDWLRARSGATGLYGNWSNNFGVGTAWGTLTWPSY